MGKPFQAVLWHMTSQAFTMLMHCIYKVDFLPKTFVVLHCLLRHEPALSELKKGLYMFGCVRPIIVHTKLCICAHVVNAVS